MSQFIDDLIEPSSLNVTYESYLHIQGLLKLQIPLTSPEEHDEMLFIVVHQVYELWFKQILHEVNQCILHLDQLEFMAAMRTLKRINTVQQTLTKQVDILETMTPNDFNRFRKNLNPASGFQSFQFRLLEFKLGDKHEAYLKFHKNQPEHYALLQDALVKPTLYDHFLHALAAKGLSIPVHILKRDTSKMHEPDEKIVKLFADIYTNPERSYDLYLLLESLADIDQHFLLWRHRHVAMVARMIGTKRGTGGSSGVDYLNKTLSKRFFPEIWELRNLLET